MVRYRQATTSEWNRQKVKVALSRPFWVFRGSLLAMEDIHQRIRAADVFAQVLRGTLRHVLLMRVLERCTVVRELYMTLLVAKISPESRLGVYLRTIHLSLPVTG